MSLAIPTIDEIRIAIREEIRAELAAARAATTDHSPLEELTPKALASERAVTANAIEKALKANPPTVRGEKRGNRWVILRGHVCVCPSCKAWAKAGGR